MINFFWESFVETWHIIFGDVEEYSTMCTWMKIIMDEKVDKRIKWMKNENR
jgi:hypothetical protein